MYLILIESSIKVSYIKFRSNLTINDEVGGSISANRQAAVIIVAILWAFIGQNICSNLVVSLFKEVIRNLEKGVYLTTVS